MITLYRTHATFIGASAVVAGIVLLAGELAVFDLTQPGHSLNKYYEQLHPALNGVMEMDTTTTGPAAQALPVSAVSQAPVIRMPVDLVVTAPTP